MSLPFIGFLQALGLVLYCSLVSLVFANGANWFGFVQNSVGPIAMLLIFVVSALICALIALSYPVMLFWDQKKIRNALKLVAFTAGWLFLIVVLTLSIFIIRR